eukprot:9477064-Pyramimonas_sp.AAC.1
MGSRPLNGSRSGTGVTANHPSSEPGAPAASSRDTTSLAGSRIGTANHPSSELGAPADRSSRHHFSCGSPFPQRVKWTVSVDRSLSSRPLVGHKHI